MKYRTAAISLFLTGVFCVAVLGASAQTVTGTLSGRVTDQSGATVAKTQVTAKNEQTGGMREATTNDDGYYQISFLPIGSYQVTAVLQGFRTVEKNGVLVELNKNTVSSFTLEPATVSASVEVRGGEIPLIETTTGEIKHSLDSQQIEATPLPGRNFISLIEQIPGFQNAPWIGSSNNPTNSTGSYVAVGGAGSRSSTFQIDGVNNDDSSENQNRQNVNVSTIKEVQVLTNAYSAEFGRGGGAVVLVQTKSGTNSFHGDAYDFLQNDYFNANGFFQNRSGTPRGIVRRNHYGGTIGGPILRDKLFFFGSGDRLANVGTSSITRFVWLPSDGPRACNPEEVAAPNGPYCVDPATHPNLQRDLTFMKSVVDLWKTPELQGKVPDPNDTTLCPDLKRRGRNNRCVRVDGLAGTFPDSDYSGKIDWLTTKATTATVRYQYSRQIRKSPRIIFGDNFGTGNHRQYNIGTTLTHVFSDRQTGELRYGFGNRSTNQGVTDGNEIPTIRFGNTDTNSGTVIGTSTNVPINRRQRDHQLVYNHTILFNRHTLRMGIDERFQALDDTASGTQRGFWTFSSISTFPGFLGWENFLAGRVSSFTRGIGPASSENRFGETNLYVQDDFRLRRNLIVNLGLRWEGVRGPREIHDLFSYGYGSSLKNFEPRFGFAWTPETKNRWIGKITGGHGNFVIRGGYGIAHDRVFQSIFTQSGLNIRFQPPSGLTASFSELNCPINSAVPFNEISDPLCGAPQLRTQPPPLGRISACNGDAGNANGVRVRCGKLLTPLLLVDPNFRLPYAQQWNLTTERKLPWNMAVQLGYNGNRGIGLPFFLRQNRSMFPIVSPLASVNVGGTFKPIVFDRVCKDFTDPMCVTSSGGTVVQSQSGVHKRFDSLTSASPLAQKGIVIVDGVPHGYISLFAGSQRYAERQPDPTNGANVSLTNFGWSYYHAMTLKVTKAASKGLTVTGAWTLSKTIDTGSEPTTTFVDTNFPPGFKDPVRSMRGLSSYDTRHRVVISYSYELPWMKSQPGILGRVVGGWSLSGVTTFQSGNPFSVLAGYDVNLDGEGGDRAFVKDPSVLFRSVDAGRQGNTCSTSGRVCQDTLSQLQLSNIFFSPVQPLQKFSGACTIGTLQCIPGDQIPITPGEDGTNSLGRNTFFTQGMKNFDMSLSKSLRIAERFKLEARMELYNVFNRTMFDTPARTIISSTPLGRIGGQRNASNFVSAYRDDSARMGQVALRLIF